MYPPPYNSATVQQQVATRVSQAMKRVFLKMTLALLVTAFVSMWGATSHTYLSFIATHSWSIWALIIAEFAILFGVNGAMRRMSSSLASGLFYLFAVINGLLMAPIFLIYTETSIAKTFFITAGTFGAMAVYGYFTNRDLSRIGNILSMALWGLIIAIVVNLFMHSSQLDWIISILGVVIFTGLTAWDTQQIKNMALMMPESKSGHLATMGALMLYLDFVNLFLYLLRFFGNSRD
ncbi:MAG: Bax inhibitor-1/YccA family protein [Muribaculaceae bacterium]|nr:Bax inhibitor-1/YccA family protein [Muribaculaceae bacterium]